MHKLVIDEELSLEKWDTRWRHTKIHRKKLGKSNHLPSAASNDYYPVIALYSGGNSSEWDESACLLTSNIDRAEPSRPRVTSEQRRPQGDRAPTCVDLMKSFAMLAYDLEKRP